MKSARIIVPLILLSGCTSVDESAYPSLAPRPIELIDLNARPVDPSLPSPPADAALSAQLSAIEGRAIAGNAKFEPAFAAAQRATAAARGSAVSSEAWVVANMDISRAEAATAETAAASSEIDRLVSNLVARASVEPGVAGLDQALATQRRVNQLYLDQINRVRALSAQLNGG